jgi:hypothetical protein
VRAGCESGPLPVLPAGALAVPARPLAHVRITEMPRRWAASSVSSMRLRPHPSVYKSGSHMRAGRIAFGRAGGSRAGSAFLFAVQAQQLNTYPHFLQVSAVSDDMGNA